MPLFLVFDTLNDEYKGYTCILVCIVHKYNVISNTVICSMVLKYLALTSELVPVWPVQLELINPQEPLAQGEFS